MKARKGFTLFITNEDINDVMKIIKSLEDSGVLTDGVTETVKQEIKKRWLLGALLPPLAASLSLMQPLISSVVKNYSWNLSMCIYENSKDFKSITSVTESDEIITIMDVVSTETTNTIARNVTSIASINFIVKMW